MRRREFLTSIAASAAAMTVAAPAVRAQAFPSRPVTIIIPFAPGGGSDVVARAIAPLMGQKLGGTVVVENVSGAAGTIASTRVSRAAPDGYTLIIQNIAFALNAAFKPDAFKPENFSVITMVNSTPGVLISRKDLPVNNVKELVEYAKNNRLRLGHPGIGSSGHLSVSLMHHALGGLPADMIPYRGGGPQLQDTVAGHIDMCSVVVANGLEPIRTGQVKGVGTLSKTRHRLLPDVPSFFEDIKPLSESLFWNVLMAPPGTPKDIIDKINGAYEEAIKDPMLVASWDRTGTDIYPPEQRGPEGAVKYLNSEFDNWKRVAKELKLEGPSQ
jgi:tripartite-type tricarboxylate transporter receptor subunit TctC